MSHLLDLSGKVALITGAGQGIGRQIALHFASNHADGVVVNDYFLDRAEKVAAEINNAGGKALPLQADVTAWASVADMAERARAHFGRPVDILVNNAGNAGASANSVIDDVPFWESDPHTWGKWLDVNLMGVMNCCRAVVPGMVERNGGRVITIISDAGRVGEPKLEVYSAAKAGAAGFMRALAKSVGRYNITANAVSIATVKSADVNRSTRIEDEEITKKILKNYVIRRWGEPSDIANMVLFLASNAAGWVTGQTYPVNGGYSINQ